MSNPRGWTDQDLSKPREEWGAAPQATLEDVQSAQEGLRRYYNREEAKQEERRREAAKDAVRRAQYYDDLDEKIKRQKELEALEEQRKIDKYIEEENLREERQRHREAVRSANARYEGKSWVYRATHRKLTQARASKMTTDEINMLFGGVTETQETEMGRTR